MGDHKGCPYGMCFGLVWATTRIALRVAIMRRSTVLILVLLAICLLLLLADRVIGLGVVKGSLAWVLSPLQRAFYDGGEQVGDFWERLREAERLQEENKRLWEVVEQLTSERLRYQEIEHENQELRTLLGLRERYPELELLEAEVIGRDPTGWQQVLRVGWTTQERPREVREGMAVIAPAGLVGRVIRVYPNAADVLLITDIGSSVSAVVQTEGRPTGVVDGRWQEGTRLIMRYLPQGAVLHEGDWVLTSGLRLPPFEEEGFPPGIPIGRILHLVTVADLHQQVELVPAVDFERLEWISIVLGTKSP